MAVLTKRQANILGLLLRKQNGISLTDLIKFIGVSRRTIYRDLSEIKPVLKDKNIKIVKQDNLYFLKGKERDSLVKFKDELQILPELSIEQRRNILAIKLLLENDYQKIVALAYELDVSKNTIINDLSELEELFEEYNIRIIREKSKGIIIKGQEEQRRDLLCCTLMNSFNNYDLFEILNNEDKNHNYIFGIISFKLLKKCYEAIKENFETINVSDLQLIQSIFMLYISVIRINNHCYVRESYSDYVDTKIKDKVEKILLLLVDTSSILQAETYFVAQYFNYSGKIHFELFDMQSKEENDITRKTFELMHRVSLSYHFNFEGNDLFTKGIVKHISRLVQNQHNQLPNLKIETLESIKERFPKLFEVVSQEWNEIFNIEITNTEKELLLLYFAGAYLNQNDHLMSVLIICENGIGTSAILKKRLEKYFPTLSKIETSKVSELTKDNIKNHDIILSTVKLNNFPRDYLTISPLLFPEEIERIRKYVQSNIVNNNHIFEEQKKDIIIRKSQPIEISHAKDKIKYLILTTDIVKSIFKNFATEDIQSNLGTIEALVYYIVNDVNTNILDNKIEIINALIHRNKVAPIAIPDTQIALLHTSQENVNEACFRVYNLVKPIQLLNMNYELEEIKRVILLLGNKDESKIQDKLLSVISSLLVMNKESYEIMRYGSEEKIKDLLANHLLNYLIELTQNLK